MFQVENFPFELHEEGYYFLGKNRSILTAYRFFWLIEKFKSVNLFLRFQARKENR